MSVKYGKFELPSKITTDAETATPTFTRFVAEPFERGYGHTCGNSLRRILLSSLESPAIISIRIEGVLHEYMAIEGIVEDITNILLNLKGALLRKLVTEEQIGAHDVRIMTSTIEVTQEEIDQNNGQADITLGRIISQGNFQIVNPDLHIFSVTKPLKRQVDLRIAIGRGYVPSERHILKDKLVDEILLDAAFSPVRLVNYYVENTRVGQDTDFDRLVIDVTTDGRVTPLEALTFAAQIGTKHFDVFTKLNPYGLAFDEDLDDEDVNKDEIMEKLALRIDEIELSVRSTNCLSGANIETIAELVSIPERKMLEFRNFGKKSLNEIKEKLTDMELHLGMDLSRYGITHDNVKEKIRRFQDARKSKKEKFKDKEQDQQKDPERDEEE